MHFFYAARVCAASKRWDVTKSEWRQENVIMRPNRLAMLCLTSAAALMAVIATNAHALETQTSNGVNFIVGGISDDERAELAGRKDFSLLVKTAAKAGNYLSDVNVNITTSKGAPVFETSMNGPWLMVRLAPGNYTLSASYNGVNKTQRISIPKSGRREVMLYWDVRVED
jgi:hypothetical protein